MEGSQSTSEEKIGVYKIMKDFGTHSATSWQRVFPVDPGDDFSRVDLSNEPLEGDFTDDLFLAHRDEVQLSTQVKRKRRRELEMLCTTGLLGDEMLVELEELRNDDDAESETSVTSITDIVVVDEDGNESRTPIQYLKAGDRAGTNSECDPDCFWKTCAPWLCNDEASSSIISCFNESQITEKDPTLGHYSYDTLPTRHIRILEIEPGGFDAPVFCKLHVVDLSSIPKHDQADKETECLSKYEALSYHWGLPERTYLITCDDISVHISRNLFSAIIHLRKPHSCCYIWADALCINQSDITEKNAQVRQMLKIYQRAFRVIVWLGESGDDGETAIRFLKALDKQQLRGELFGQSPHHRRCYENLARGSSAVQKTLARPWFRRSWIRQELAAGRKVLVQCGLETVSWTALKRSSSRIGRVREVIGDSDFSELAALIPTQATEQLSYLKRGWTYGQRVINSVAVAGSLFYWHGGGLLDILIAGTHFEATDPRDKVYSILGLAREPVLDGDNEDALYPSLDPSEKFEPMTIDYHSTINEVYQRLAKHFINRDANLDILCVLSGRRSQEPSDLPSWTPDWRIPWRKSLFDALEFRFFASGYTRAERQYQNDLGKLSVRAYFVDEIAELLDVTSTTWDLLYENGQAIIASDGKLENRTAWRGTPIFESFDAESGYRRCCKTRRGHVALVPADSNVDDTIAVILGARFPFVLKLMRAKKSKQDRLMALEANTKRNAVRLLDLAAYQALCKWDLSLFHDGWEEKSDQDF